MMQLATVGRTGPTAQSTAFRRRGPRASVAQPPARAAPEPLAARQGPAYKSGMSAPELSRDDLAATVAARRELGDDSEREVVEAFLDRVGSAIDARVDQRLAEREGRPGPNAARSQGRGGGIALALGSMGIGIAVTGASAGLDNGEQVAIIAWLVIGAINVAHALRS
jgi:hypothetical protein